MSNRKVSGSLVAVSLLLLGLIGVFLSMVFVKISIPNSDCTEAVESVKKMDSVIIHDLRDSVQYLRTHPVHDTVLSPKDTTKFNLTNPIK